jgi:hypothetical protein
VVSQPRESEAAAPAAPLLVWTDGELDVVARVEDLPRTVSCEALDGGGVVVHDAHGRRVLVHVARERTKVLGFARVRSRRVVVDGVDVAGVHADRLAERLGAWLEERGETGARGLALGELVKRAVLRGR